MIEKDLTYYMALPYTIELIPGEDNGGWYARIPLLEGCMADGDTQAEALAALEEVKQLWLDVALESGGRIPEPKMETA